MKFNLRQFYSFCSQLKIETKEQGLRNMDTLLGSQTYVMEELAKGLDEDVHFFVILKGRQLGITTVALALDLYWQFTHIGWQGTLVSDTEENRDMFRSTLAMYMDGLPKQYKIPLRAHNRNQLVLENRSRIFYQIAGNKNRLGQGKAITYLHGTETASWGSEEGLASLIASLAETNPERLYIFESTAQGFNMFHDMYLTAKRARTQRAIFCGWWRNQLYTIDPTSDVYKVYWDGKLTGEEKEWVGEVKKLYGVEINSRQMAWWRWKMYEGIKDDALMYQEFPPCVVADTRVGTNHGIIKISDAHNGMLATKGIVADTHRHSEKQIYRITTSLGYELRGSYDHPIFSEAGVLVPMKDTLNVRIQLCSPRFAEQQSLVLWKEGPIDSTVIIDGMMARFIGIFMGDGSFAIKNASRNPNSGCGVLSIAFDSKDQDFIESTTALIEELFGIPVYIRSVSENGKELRASSIMLTRFMNALGLTTSETGKTMRKVHVPEFIWRSPQNVVKEFLSGIFETDGFADINGNRIVLFSKHKKFLKDIQLLLLGFGVTAKVTSSAKKATKDGVPHEYVGNELTLRKNEVILFAKKIGFLSNRKIQRSNNQKNTIIGTKPIEVEMLDTVVEVVEDGFEPVYNLTIEGDHTFDANGIHTHNTEHYAFVMTGTGYFSNARCTDAAKIAKKLNCDFYRYSMGANFQDTEVLKSTERLGVLRIWEEPVDTAYYVIGADPAYGSSDWADRFCIQVFRAYADGMEQVAEFAASELNTYQFAWVIAHLAGAYKNSTLNLEVNGPGQAVINELRNLKRQAATMGGAMGTELMNVYGSMQNYIWRRNDTLGGISNSIGWLTTTQTKERMLSYMKDYFERGMMDIFSMELLDEMKTIVRDGGTIKATGRNKDDRVIAAALAAAAFAEQVQPRLIQQRITRKVSRVQDDFTPEQIAVGRNVSDYLKRLGLYGQG